MAKKKGSKMDIDEYFSFDILFQNLPLLAYNTGY